MISKTIYILYYITNQTKQILKTYSKSTEEIIIHGHYIYLYSILHPDKHLDSKEKYDIFEEYITNVKKQPFDSSNELHYLIKNTIDVFFSENISVPNYDSCRLTICLEEFKNLKKLHLSNLYLYEILNIQNNVESIYIEHCFLKRIDIIPDTLKFFYCDNNELVRLPRILHTNLEVLSFKNNNVLELPNLPNGIKYLIFSNNRICKIPNFPKALKYLECSWNRIQNIDKITKNINTIICDHNDISKLPCLSELHLLNILICNSNKIIELPPLPGIIEFINCSDNPISIFVPFPFSLIG
jgi:hypothetical protein